MSEARENLAAALSDEEVADIEAAVSHLPRRQAAAIDALKMVQDRRGWISDASLAAIADLLDMSADELDSIATFYNLIFRRPVGEKVILSCDSVSCWIMGSDAVCSRIKQKLNVEMGETTGDGRYTLLPVTCLGDCNHAPVLMIDDELHRDVTPASVDDLFEEGS